MRQLLKTEEEQAKHYMERAAEVALLATCSRSQCGTVIVKDDQIIGEGYNTPPKNLDSERRCHNEKSIYHPKVTDKTCCIHAEVRAILNALRTHPEKLEGSTLYFIRLDTEGKKQFSGTPYCTICSKLSLDVGIVNFVLWHASGIMSYPTDEYNQLSFAYQDKESVDSKILKG